MCTVSIVPLARGFRVSCNRDELRTRPRASGPVIHADAGMTSIWPVDPVSAGTWIGVNDAGVVLVLLNRSDRLTRQMTSATESRGTIIPRLIHQVTVQKVLEAALRLDQFRFAPFTLVALHGGLGLSLTMNATRRILRSHDLSRPHLFTSSSLGDDLAVRVRGPLFAALVERSRDTVAGQAAFHRHRWSDRPEISVRMARSDAATVSITTIDVCERRVHMSYAGIEERPCSLS
jgi:transport and Golgi organization protein 2